MARRDKKHKNVLTMRILLDGGLDRSEDEREIPENAMTWCYNMVYDVGDKNLRTRPGLAWVTNGIVGGGTLSQILATHFYVKDASNSWLMCAADGFLYHMDYDVLVGATPLWTLVGALTDSETKPSFLTFNGILLIADGHTYIRTWDGSTYDQLDAAQNESPSATALFEIGNRIVANDKNDPDAVHLSGPEDENDWNSSTGAAVSVRAGFGDGMKVNGFASMRDLLIVSKVGTGSTVSKKLWSMDLSGNTPDDWYATYLSHTNASAQPHTITNMLNDVVFIDTDGIHSVLSVQEYGDIQTDTKFGARISSEVSALPGIESRFLTKRGAVWFLFAGTQRMFAYHPLIGQSGAYTELNFGKKMRTVVEAGEYSYITSDDGVLYRLDEDSKTDELTEDVLTNVTTDVRTKLFTFEGEKGIVRYVSPGIQYNLSGLVKVGVYDRHLDIFHLLGQIELEALPAEQYLFDANGDLYDANEYLGKAAIYTGDVRQRFRSRAIMFAIQSTSGSYSLANITARIAIVKG
jgi:outer membrane protein assembly factor BamB